MAFSLTIAGALHLSVLYLAPMQTLFKTVPLTWRELLVTGAGVSFQLPRGAPPHGDQARGELVAHSPVGKASRPAGTGAASSGATARVLS